jgi:cell division protein FtsW
MSTKRQPVDKVFLALVLVELFFGMVMLTSASGPLSYDHYHSSWIYIRHQLIAGAVPGLIGMWILSRLDFRRWERWSPFIMLIGLFLMVLVFVPGLAVGYGTAHSWIAIGSFFSFQPVEFLKLAMIIYLAALAAAPNRAPGQIFLPAGLMFVVVAVLLALQPDFGSLLILAAIFLIVVYAAGVPFSYLLGTAMAGGGLLYAFAKTASYRAARLTVFLHPELDPQGIGYQINQAFLAIGSGGLWGLGLGHSQQKYSYLPQVMNDSVYPIIAEELGFFFALGLVVLIAAIFFRGLKIAREARDPFGRVAVIGVVSWLTVQSFLNIGAMIGLVPLTGVPLPFVSYGGTAMVMNLCAVGLVLSVSRGNG